MIPFAELQYGFQYGAAELTRLFSDKKKGWVVLGLRTPKHPDAIQLYVTRTGKVRIFSKEGEWKPSRKKKS